MIDLSQMPLAELLQLRRDITNTLEGFNSNRRRQAQLEIQAICKKYGYEIKDLFGDRIKPDHRQKSG